MVGLAALGPPYDSSEPPHAGPTCGTGITSSRRCPSGAGPFWTRTHLGATDPSLCRFRLTLLGPQAGAFQPLPPLQRSAAHVPGGPVDQKAFSSVGGRQLEDQRAGLAGSEPILRFRRARQANLHVPGRTKNQDREIAVSAGLGFDLDEIASRRRLGPAGLYQRAESVGLLGSGDRDGGLQLDRAGRFWDGGEHLVGHRLPAGLAEQGDEPGRVGTLVGVRVQTGEDDLSQLLRQRRPVGVAGRLDVFALAVRP